MKEEISKGSEGNDNPEWRGPVSYKIVLRVHHLELSCKEESLKFQMVKQLEYCIGPSWLRRRNKN